MNTKKLVRFSFLLAASVLLNYIETLIPLPFVFFGAKLGLANALGIVVLYFFGVLSFIEFGFLRVLLSATLFNGFGMSFYISLGGMILASLITLILYLIGKFSIYAISVAGAIMHGVGQVLVVCILYGSSYLFLYVLLLSISGIITGLLVAFISKQIIVRLPNKKALD